MQISTSYVGIEKGECVVDRKPHPHARHNRSAGADRYLRTPHQRGGAKITATCLTRVGFAIGGESGKFSGLDLFPWSFVAPRIRLLDRT